MRSYIVQNVKVLNSPARCYSVHNPAPLVMSGLTIDDCMRPLYRPVLLADLSLALGDQPNSASGGKAAGHNTDGFDVGTHDLTIKDRYACGLLPSGSILNMVQRDYEPGRLLRCDSDQFRCPEQSSLEL